VITGLRAATQLRFDAQLSRAFRHGFGGEGGLRVVVRLATQELLRDGVPREEIRQTLLAAVRAHAEVGDNMASVFSGRSRADALDAMIVRWSDSAEVTETRR
jgi:hypothetical protein